MKTTYLAFESTKNESCIVNSPEPRRWRGLLILPAIGLLLVLLSSQAWAQPISIWDDSTVPDTINSGDPNSVELGLRFRSSVNGTVTGLRFYKSEGNTGTHIGALWTGDGTLLGAVEFANESASGWQEQAMTPVAIQANTTYVVSYHAQNGMYSVDAGYFASSGFNNGPLQALADGEDGGNGLFEYAPGGVFPTFSFNSANYWVDVVFEPETTTGCEGDTNPPVLVVPCDVIFQCTDCDIDPANTGTATATDECTFTITHKDVVIGDCPKVVKRTWTATDENGNCSSGVQTITCLPPVLVTDSAGCSFDRYLCTDGADFQLMFNEDPKKRPCDRLVASNPGQFLLNVFYVGVPGQQVAFNLTLPYPFVTQGNKPIQAYDWVTIDSSYEGQCLSPGKGIFSSSQKVSLKSYGTLPNASTTVPVSLKVPASGVVCLTVHLDYGLKQTTGYQMNASGDALDCATGTKILVPNHHQYVFSVAGAASGSASIRNSNDFK